MKKSLGRKIVGMALAMTISATILLGSGVSAFAYTQTTGTVTSDNVKVRSSASTTASHVSSLKNGDKVDIVDEAKDASGYVWYKIYINKTDFGYVRSDLVKKAGGSSSSSSDTPAASLPDTSVTSTEQRTATITTDSANVRKGAGTAYESVGRVSKGDTVTVTGEASGTDGKTWYQVTFGANAKTGFVRGDLLTINEAAPAEENQENTENVEGGEVAEGEGSSEEGQSQGSTSVVSDAGDGTYSLVYTTDDSGAGIWYLYDNAGGYRVKVKELIETAQSATAVNDLRKKNKSYKKIIIALAILAVALLAGVVILALKLRDSLYYEDDAEEEYDRYSKPNRGRDTDAASSRRSREYEPRERDRERESREARESRTVTPERTPRRQPADENQVRPTRRNADEQYEGRPVRRTERSEEDYPAARPTRRPERPERPERTQDDYEQERAPRREVRRPDEDRSQRRYQEVQPKEQPAPKRKTRNFIGDDDDFEFEFLDLDDDK